MPADTLKTAAIAGFLGLGIAALSAGGAAAYTLKARCYGDDCVRIQCNNGGYDCYRIGYFDARTRFGRPFDITRFYDANPYTACDGKGCYAEYDVHHYRNHFDPDNDYNEDDYPN